MSYLSNPAQIQRMVRITQTNAHVRKRANEIAFTNRTTFRFSCDSLVLNIFLGTVQAFSLLQTHLLRIQPQFHESKQLIIFIFVKMLILKPLIRPMKLSTTLLNQFVNEIRSLSPYTLLPLYNFQRQIMVTKLSQKDRAFRIPSKKEDN